MSFTYWELPLEALTREYRVHLCPSIDCPPKFEMKTLLSYLKYAFLGGHNIILVIITVDLTEAQERALLSVLKVHRKAIGWMMADVKGTSPSIV